MKSFLFASLFILSAAVFAGNNNFETFLSYPPYAEVVEEFDKNYMGAPSNFAIDFAKKPEGYFVVLNDVKTYESKKEFLFWSIREKAFLPLGNDFTNGDDTFDPNNYYNQAYSFDHALYFNYDEANTESIKALELEKDLPNLLLEALARAYAGTCSTLADKRNLNRTELRMSPETLKTYVEFAQKTVQTYAKLKKKDPNYETIVGSVQTKYSNECMNFWYELMVNEYETEASEFLKDELYDPIMLNFAKNFLITCRDSAILFTIGDNDTYPLWYVQEKLNYRKDVAVINSSLANVQFYNDFHIKRHGLKTMLTEKDRSDDRLAYLTVSLIKEQPLPIVGFVERLKLENDERMPKFSDTEILNPQYSNVLVKTVDGETIMLSLTNGIYYYSDIFILDLIASNSTKRPIVFAAYFSPIAKSTNSKQNNILSYELALNVGDRAYSKSSKSFENLEHSYDLFMNKFQFEKKRPKNDVGDRVVYNYTVIISTLARSLHQANKKDEAIKVLNKLEAVFPIDKLKNGGSLAFYQAQIWNEMDEKEQAIICVDKALTLLDKTMETSPEEFTRIDQTLQYLEQFCTKNEYDFLDRLKTLRAKLITLKN